MGVVEAHYSHPLSSTIFSSIVCARTQPVRPYRPRCATMPVEWAKRPRLASLASGELRRMRKVRAPQGRALANGEAGRPDGKWHRNIPPFIAKAMKGKGEMVR